MGRRLGRVGVCIIGGHLQLNLQIGASSGVGGSLGYTTYATDAGTASQLSGFGAGFGASGGGGVVAGGDRCFTRSEGQTINCVTQTTGIGLKVSPEVATPAEIHAYGSFTIDFNDLVAGLIDALP
jgi:hypothetical protein